MHGREGQGPGSGPGSALAVISGSTHDTAVDVRALFNSKIGWLLKRLVPRKEVSELPFMCHNYLQIVTLYSK